MRIIPFEDRYRDDMIFMVLQAKDVLGRVPRLNEDLLDIQRNYFDSGDMFWVALDERGRVVGCIGTKIEGTDMRLRRLYVKADLKRQGIGSKLLLQAESFARKRGVQRVWVHLGEKESYFGSYFFYPKHGYTEFQPRMMEKLL